MKKTGCVIVNRKEFEAELTIAKKIMAGKTHLAIISNVVLSFLPESMVIQATNLEHAYFGVTGKPINRKFRVSADAPKVLVSLDRLMRVVKAIPKKTTEFPLEITWDGEGLKVNGTTTIVQGGMYNDYPCLPKLPWGLSYNLLSYEKINQVNGIPFNDDRREHIRCLYVNGPAGHLVSTDGSRLYIVTIPKAADMKPFFLPKKTAAILTCSQLKAKIGAVRIDKLNAYIETGNGFISVRLPEGQFPDYGCIIPERDPVAVVSTADKQDVIDVMMEAAAILNDNYKGVVITGNGALTITATNPDSGEFQKDVSKDFTYAGAQFEFALNQAFIIDACKSIQDKGVNMYVWGNEYPAVFESAGGDFKAVIMPMRY